MSRLRILVCTLAIGTLSAVALVQAQRKDFNIYDAGGIPRALQQSLVDRLKLFVEFQRNDEWDKVADMLGEFSSSISSTRTKYTVVERQWVVEKLKEKSMNNFMPRRVQFSTASIDLPLSRRWWYVEGEAELLQGGSKEQVVIAPYRDKGEWYFQPMVVTLSGWEPLLRPTSNKRLQRTRR